MTEIMHEQQRTAPDGVSTGRDAGLGSSLGWGSNHSSINSSHVAGYRVSTVELNRFERPTESKRRNPLPR